jgi:hypothetical protein
VATAIGMQFSLPNRHILSPTFLFLAVESLLIVVLLSGRGSSRIDRWSVARRRVTLGPGDRDVGRQHARRGRAGARYSERLEG